MRSAASRASCASATAIANARTSSSCPSCLRRSISTCRVSCSTDEPAVADSLSPMMAFVCTCICSSARCRISWLSFSSAMRRLVSSVACSAAHCSRSDRFSRADTSTTRSSCATRSTSAAAPPGPMPCWAGGE
eukprot:scaffold8977_cov128-Isochrysis_galbana.AAC.11